MRPLLSLACLTLIAAGTLSVVPDDFDRERGSDSDALKDALEGKRPPELVARDWLNTDEPLVLRELVGKVVLLDFWGTW